MDIVKKILIAIVFLVMFGYFAWSGISPLFAKLDTSPLSAAFDGSVESGDYVKGDVLYCTPEVLEISHSVSFIPTGKEHYYFIYHDEDDSCIAIRADKNWYEKECLDGDTVRVPIKGAVKKLDFDTRKELQESLAYIHGSELPQFSELYIDMQSDRYGIFTIISLVVMAGLGVAFLLLGNVDVKSIPGRIVMFLLFADLAFMLHILAMV